MGAPTTPERARPHGGSRHAPDWLVLTLACVAQFMVVLDVSIVNVALPAMKTSLGFSESGLQWVLNAYTLTFAGFLLLGGRTADLFGRRKIFLVGLGVFTAASLLGGLAESQAWLIGARAVQGIGGAILSPATLTILTTTFTDPKRRSRAMGVWSAVAGAGGAAGALLGGILTQELSWRWILFINIPIGIVTMLLGRAYLQESRAMGERPSLDLPGAVLVTAGLSTLVLGVVRTTSVGWASWQTLLTLAVAALLVAGFLLYEAKVAKSPLMPLAMFRRRPIWSANLTMFLLSGALFAMWFFVSLYLQQVRGYTPIGTGFAFLPQAVAIVVGAQLSSRILVAVGPRPLLVLGALSSAGGLYWLGQVGLSTGYWSGFFVPSVLVTFGLGLSFTPLAYSATAGVRPEQAGLASGLVNTSRQIGGAIGLAALATLATTRMNELVGQVGPRQAASSAYAGALEVSAAIALAAAVAALFVPALRHRTPPEAAPGEVRPAPVPVGAPE
ncbi:MAG TPA: MFS transporter [Acidimicrobiales bacterium]|nr:MFS transporter [Acidimicrobiales bacterium]